MIRPLAAVKDRAAAADVVVEDEAGAEAAAA